MHRNRILIRFILATTILLAITGYGLFEARRYLAGPEILVSEPADGAVVDMPVVNIRGTAENISSITLNGRAIFIDTEGNFSEPLALMPGYNLATLAAEDRFGKQTERQIHVFYEPPEHVTSPVATTTGTSMNQES